MIQRIQSLYLLVAGIASAICAYLCQAGLVKGQYIPALAGEDFTLAGPILCILIALLSMVTIFLYKNRKRQMKMCWLTILLSIVGALFFVWVIAAAIFVLLAWRGIRADERLIRSIDRIR